MKKTLIVGMALAAVAFFALWHGGPTSDSARVDAQQNRNNPNERVVAVLDVGDLQAAFVEVSGIGSESEVLDFRDGGQSEQKVLKIPGRLKWQDITLKRGLTSDLELWKWRKMVEDGGEGFRKNGSLTLLNRNRQSVAQWDFKNAWPSKISGPQRKADGNDVSTEEITIVHEFIERVR